MDKTNNGPKVHKMRKIQFSPTLFISKKNSYCPFSNI